MDNVGTIPLAGPERDRAEGASPQPAVYRALVWLLRSPVSGMVDASLTLVTVRGRRSGRQVTLPVQYAAGDDAIWIWPGRARTKRWWRNLIVESPVRLRLLGTDVDGRASVVVAGSPSFEHGRRTYAARFPRHGKAGVAGGGTDPMVRVEVAPDVLARVRSTTVVPGRGLLAAVRRHPLAAYFLLAYLFSWGYWIPLAITGGQQSHFPGLLGPMLAAITVTALATGSNGIRDLARRMARWRVPLRWYAAALIPLAAAAIALIGLRVAGQRLPSLDELSTMPGLPEVGWLGVFVLTVRYGEETGWRGCAWPRLRQRHSIGGAALILAVPWAIWHIPTFLIDTGMRDFPVLLIPGFLLGMAAGAVVLGWVYEHARSSILIVALWHASLNMASATEGTAAVVAASSVAVIFWAVAILRSQYTRAMGRSGTRLS